MEVMIQQTKRRRFSTEARELMEATYLKVQYPGNDLINNLAGVLDEDFLRIKRWFLHRRRQTKTPDIPVTKPSASSSWFPKPCKKTKSHVLDTRSEKPPSSTRGKRFPRLFPRYESNTIPILRTNLYSNASKSASRNLPQNDDTDTASIDWHSDSSSFSVPVPMKPANAVPGNLPKKTDDTGTASRHLDSSSSSASVQVKRVRIAYSNPRQSQHINTTKIGWHPNSSSTQLSVPFQVKRIQTANSNLPQNEDTNPTIIDWHPGSSLTSVQVNRVKPAAPFLSTTSMFNRLYDKQLEPYPRKLSKQDQENNKLLHSLTDLMKPGHRSLVLPPQFPASSCVSDSFLHGCNEEQMTSLNEDLMDLNAVSYHSLRMSSPVYSTDSVIPSPVLSDVISEGKTQSTCIDLTVSPPKVSPQNKSSTNTPATMNTVIKGKQEVWLPSKNKESRPFCLTSTPYRNHSSVPCFGLLIPQTPEISNKRKGFRASLPPSLIDASDGDHSVVPKSKSDGKLLQEGVEKDHSCSDIDEFIKELNSFKATIDERISQGLPTGFEEFNNK